ncbi:hypothetical protein EVAR_2592_1 [Eumeta japonica]|uniref:Uncharacterized protein n=1 Tax=Eumeta variegata TaxID=151549 RepID=A0A4C1SMA6_EUMVA|nr:hypothetical protein EVAR_2592_1 [Eumeta japonica]
MGKGYIRTLGLRKDPLNASPMFLDVDTSHLDLQVKPPPAIKVKSEVFYRSPEADTAYHDVGPARMHILSYVMVSFDNGINSSQIENNDKNLFSPVHVEKQDYVRVTEVTWLFTRDHRDKNKQQTLSQRGSELIDSIQRATRMFHIVCGVRPPTSAPTPAGPPGDQLRSSPNTGPGAGGDRDEVVVSKSRSRNGVPLDHRKTVDSEWYATICLPEVFEEIRKNNDNAESFFIMAMPAVPRRLSKD